MNALEKLESILQNEMSSRPQLASSIRKLVLEIRIADMLLACNKDNRHYCSSKAGKLQRELDELNKTNHE